MTAHTGKFVIGLMVGTMLLFGCAKTPLKVKPLARTENPSALLEKLGNDLAMAKKDRVDLLSPNWYAGALLSYANAKAGLSKGVAIDKILSHLATGQAQLSQSLDIAEKSKKKIGAVIESRDAAIKAGADKRNKKDFAKLEGDFIKLTKAVESDNAGYIRNKRKSLNDQYSQLELAAIKDTLLVDVRRLMRTAQRLNMEDKAPKSYQTAQKKFAEAEALIAKNRYSTETIQTVVGEADFFGRRLHHIAGMTGKLDDMEPEEIALWMESFLSQTNTQLKQPDHRNKPFKEQQQEIIDTIAMLQRNKSSALSQIQAKNLEVNKLTRRLTALEGRSSEVRADKEKLAAEKEFNELYNKVQRFFAPSQADVYKRSQHLIIRLKAMQFPVGQSVIVPNNYPLLNTVQRAIKAFGDPDVVIEGHTDSTGSETKNKELSRSRAESVQQYLVHNRTLSSNKIAAKGYGSSRPLASNATANGRAINRRIDVVIKPENR